MNDQTLKKQRKRHMRAGWDDITLDFVSYFVGITFAAICLLPFLMVVIYSFTPYDLYIKNHFDFFPARLTLQAYSQVIQYRYLWIGYKNTLIIASLGVVFSVVLMCITAYPLTKRDLIGHKLMTTLWVITMFFSGGMIPNYFLVRRLGMLNSLWALILPSMLGCYNLLLMRNYMEGIPESLEEAALLDGANDLQILFKVVLPLCIPIIATMALFEAVNYWNAYFNAIIYNTDRNKWPLQLVLRSLVYDSKAIGTVEDMAGVDEERTTPFLLKMSAIVVSTLPIMCLYPFLQKYFMTGLVLGGVKE